MKTEANNQELTVEGDKTQSKTKYMIQTDSFSRWSLIMIFLFFAIIIHQIEAWLIKIMQD